MTSFLSDDSHVYCLWFVPFDDDNKFFAAMIRDEEGDRVIYRFEDSAECSYYVMKRGDNTMRDFRRAFNLTVEEFSTSTHARMEYLPVDGGIDRALSIIEKQPWAYDILSG